MRAALWFYPIALALGAFAAPPARAQTLLPPHPVEEAGAVAPEGTAPRGVAVIVTVDPLGRVTAARADAAENAADPRVSAALDAARRYRFAPATRDGVPIASRVRIVVEVHAPAPAAPAPARAEPAAPAAPARAEPAAPARAEPAASAASAPDASDADEVRVRGARGVPSATRRSMDRREITSMPGTGGDALRTVESLPGVARAPAFSGLLIVRGSAPEDTQVFVDGSAVPLAFHFGGLSAIVPTEILDRIELHPGNYDVAWGRGIGGIVDVGLRSPAADGLHASAKLDLLDGRALVETPIDAHTRVLVGARRSWLDAWFPSVASQAQLGVVASPVYYDYQAILERDLSDRATLRAIFFGSDDRVAVTLPPGASDPSFSGTLSNATTFWRAQLRADGKIEGGTRWSAMASLGHDTFAIGLGPLHGTDDVVRAAARAELDARLSSKVRARAGIDVEGGLFDFDLVFPPVPTPDEPDIGPIYGRPPLHQTRSTTFFDPAAYGAIELAPARGWTLLAGVRADAWSRVPGVAVDPRAVVRHTLADDPRTALKAAMGLFSQAPQPYENDPVFGTAGVAFERALHVSAGIEQQIGRQVELSLEPFYKDLFDLVSRRPDASAPSGFRYGNEGTGFVYGTELLLKWRPDERVWGWIAYTISRSERRALPEEERRIFEYDQTHVLSALGSVRVGHGWEVGARVRYVTGDPYTPILGGAFDADAGAYAPIEQRPLFAARLPAFFSLDLRVEKAWTLGARARVSAYLDVMNVTNRRNVEGLTTNFDNSLAGTVSGVPLLPIVGVRGEL